jgi:glutamyl-tRNA reductase
MKQPIAIEQLRVAHWTGPPAGLPPCPPGSEAFVVETCLRHLRVSMRTAPATPGGGPAPELRTGAAAYRLLLEVATGLRSAIPGETNVLGQLKRAWEQHRQRASAESALLAPVIAQLLQDARTVRRRHLQGIGGASYGALVRRLLGIRPGERVLLVGAGELARSMLPFLGAFEVGAWSRRLPGPAFAAAGRLFAPAEGPDAAAWATHVVMTTPPDGDNDARWTRWLAASRSARTLVRLAHRRGAGQHRPPGLTCYDLDDLFDLRRSQEAIRSLQIERARLECRALAERLCVEAHDTAQPWRAAG